MTGVVAVVGSGPPSLTEAGAAVARLLRAGLRHVPATPGLQSSQPVRAVLDELARPDVLVAVIAEGAAMDATIRDVISTLPKPVVVAPHLPATRRPFVVSRVLLPLDGSAGGAAAVAPTARLLADAGVDLVVLHVFDQVTVPPCWDQAAHARDCWEGEFRARYCPQPGARLQLRTGVPGDQVVRVAEQEQVDLIVLGWSQGLDPDRAATVRCTLGLASVPVMLMPVSPSSSPPSRRRWDDRPAQATKVKGQSATVRRKPRPGARALPLLR